MVENVAGSPCASADEEMSDGPSPSSSILENPTSPIPTYVYGPDKSQPIAEIPKHVRFSGASAKGKAAVQNIKAILKAQNAARVASASSSKSSKSRRASSGSNSHSRGRREKAYRCPVSFLLLCISLLSDQNHPTLRLLDAQRSALFSFPLSFDSDPFCPTVIS